MIRKPSDCQFVCSEEALSITLEKPVVGRRYLIVSLSEEMSDRIDELSVESGYGIDEVLNMAIGLFRISLDAVNEGKQVGIAAEDQILDCEFTGLRKTDPTF